MSQWRNFSEGFVFMDYDQKISTDVSSSEVCGVNLEDDSAFQNFFFESQGTPERFDGQSTTPAEPPDWRAVKKQALVFLEKTHDLKLISILSQCVLNTEGLIKFEECLNGIYQLVTNKWDAVYPPLDEDDGDPLERVSALGYLVDDAFVLSVLKTMPIVTSKVLGKITLQAIDKAIEPGKEGSGLGISQIIGVFNDADRDELTQTYTAVNQCVVHLNAISQCFVDKAGSEYNVNFDKTIEVLSHLSNMLDKYGKVKVEVVVEEPEANNDSSIDVVNPKATNEDDMSTVSFQSNQMKLTSRKDVERCFELIANYYSEFEPSSPIPILINRSKKLVNLHFLDIIKDIYPDALDHVNQLGGITPESKEEESSSSGSDW
jgi:type VI secretion system protein ImpA